MFLKTGRCQQQFVLIAHPSPNDLRTGYRDIIIRINAIYINLKLRLSTTKQLKSSTVQQCRRIEDNHSTKGLNKEVCLAQSPRGYDDNIRKGGCPTTWRPPQKKLSHVPQPFKPQRVFGTANRVSLADLNN